MNDKKIIDYISNHFKKSRSPFNKEEPEVIYINYEISNEVALIVSLSDNFKRRNHEINYELKIFEQ